MRWIFGLGLLLCGCSLPVNPALLDAPTRSEFNKLLKDHGPVVDAEVSSLEDALRNGTPLRQHNAMKLLACARSSSARPIMERAARTTQDPELWRLAMVSLWTAQELGHHKVDPALLRADMIDLCLASSDADQFRAGFRAAAESGSPKMAAQLPKALKSDDSELFALAVVRLTPEQARENLDLLHARLVKANYQALPPLALVLIKAGAGDTLAKAYPEIKERASLHNYLMDHSEPEVTEFLFHQADKGGALGDDAYSILVGQVIWGAPCSRQLMEICCRRLERAPQDPKPVSHPKHNADSEALITHLVVEPTSKLRPDFAKLFHGSEALKQARLWLKDHP